MRAVVLLLTAFLLLTFAAVSHGASRQGTPPLLPGARWYSNAENVRRITPGRRFVAVATSGGVRTFERATGRWRLHTRNDGLPTNNVYDVAFAPDAPGTLWALCGDWSAGPSARLRLATLDLATGRATPVGGWSEPAPRTPTKYPYFHDYRLAVDERYAVVAAGSRAGIAFDRPSGAWLPAPPADAPAPPPNRMPGECAGIIAVVASPGHVAVFTNQGIWLTDRRSGRVTARPYPEPPPDGSLMAMPLVPKFVGDSGALEFGAVLAESRETAAPPTRANGAEGGEDEDGPHYVVTYSRLRFRVTPAAAGVREVNSRRPLKESEADAASEEKPISLRLTYCTESVVDGGTLWLGGYSNPYSGRNTGIVCLDLATMRADYPPSPPDGLAANVGRLDRSAKGSVVFNTENGVSIAGKDRSGFSDVGDTTGLWPERPGVMLWVKDPRPIPLPGRVSEEARGFASYFSRLLVLARLDDRSTLVVGPPDAASILSSHRVPPALFLMDGPTGTLTRMDERIPLPEGFVPQAASVRGDRVFLAGEIMAAKTAEGRRPGRAGFRYGGFSVCRWDRTTGATKVYDRAAWNEAEAAVLRILREIDPLMGSVGDVSVPAYGRPEFVEMAGQTWLTVAKTLYRYDAARDAWRYEGRADSVHPDGLDALWANLVTETGGKTHMELRRWSATTGWRRLALAPDVADGMSSFLPDRDRIWLGGIGVVALPRASLEFIPEDHTP